MISTIKSSMILSLFIVTVAIIPIFFWSPSQQIILHSDLFGRENEQHQIIENILGEPTIIELVGIAGVGKTVLILDTIDKLVNKYGCCVVYIDVSRHNSTSSLVTDIVSDHTCLSILNYMTIFTWFYGTVEFSLQSWYKALMPSTVLFFDSVDNLVEQMDNTIIKQFYATKSRAKIVLISRLNRKQFLTRPVIQLGGLSPITCEKWITSKYHDQINTENGKELCFELGGIPQVIISIVEYLRSNTSDKIGDVVAKLKTSHYGDAFAYLQSIMEPNGEGIQHHVNAIHLLYDHLTQEHKLCLWLLVDMRGSYTFTKTMVEQHLQQDTNISVDGCLDALLEHSFIETELDTQKQFKFHPYVRKFIQLCGEPGNETNRNRAVAKTFYGNYVFTNARNLYFQLQNTQNLQLAIYIGSNQRLVNSFLPILGEKYDLKQLFKMTLKVITEHCCKPSSMFCCSLSAKALFAFSYLTKALYCPSIHPPSLLLPSKPKLVQQPNGLCLQMLASCPSLRKCIGKDDKNQSAEALGYHNSLLIHVHYSPPWYLSLRDISLIITVAEHECVQYCTVVPNKCNYGRKSSLEDGLTELLLGNYQCSLGFFQSTLNKLSTNEQQCQTILKILAIIGIHRSQYDFKATAAHLLLNDINLDNLNLSCFLGVLNDLIVPFLLEVHQIESKAIRLAKRLNKTVEEEKKRCDTEVHTDKDRLDCTPRIRYTIAHGLTALRMKELQDKLKWPQKLADSCSREEWICSIIRDKTTTCEKTLPLISQVRSIETNKNFQRLWYLKYFLDEKEYEQLEKKAKEIPRFFQLMSI